MRIFIISMEDPVYTLPFIKEVMEGRKGDVVGVAVAKGGRLKIGKKRSKAVYVLSLLLIMGLPTFVRYSWKSAWFKVRKKLTSVLGDPGLLAYAEAQGIPTFAIKSPNNAEFLAKVAELKPDVIINQSQAIIKKKLLELPSIGVLNRHNALLPKNRGRITPFWVLYRQEKETGVSIHFVEEGLDSGEIVVQKRFAVDKKETFGSLVRKNYQHAGKAMLEALDKLESPDYTLLPNDDDQASYNTVPTLAQAWDYRKKRLFS